MNRKFLDVSQCDKCQDKIEKWIHSGTCNIIPNA